MPYPMLTAYLDRARFVRSISCTRASK